MLYFDVKNQRFVSGTIAVLMTLDMETPVARIKKDAKQISDKFTTSKLAVVSDNLIHINLVE